MIKKQVMISIDSRVHELAKSKKLNVSEVCERALKLKLMIKKGDMPEEVLELKCIRCGSIVPYGFFCVIRQKFICENCEIRSRCLACEHEHIRVPQIGDERTEEEIKEIINKIK